MWSMGTIFVELVLRVPFLAGDTDMDQLKKTFHAMGSPTEEEWPVRLIFLLSCFASAGSGGVSWKRGGLDDEIRLRCKD